MTGAATAEGDTIAGPARPPVSTSLSTAILKFNDVSPLQPTAHNPRQPGVVCTAFLYAAMPLFSRTQGQTDILKVVCGQMV